MKKTLAVTALSLLPVAGFAANLEDQVVENYANLAYANYSDALATAQALNSRIDQLVAQPSANTLDAARSAWITARVPYQQSEVFRFGNPVVDDWEGQLNAWPLDEGLIDYVKADHYDHELGNPGATANIVASTSLTVGGKQLNLSNLTPEGLAGLNELGGSEANVATGYHAIEFLLWGQDLNGTKPGAGNRSYTDFAKGSQCTNGNCERRGQYLQAAADLLVADLEYMVEQWDAKVSGNYRSELLAEDNTDALRRILFGMGSLSLGELAGERMKVALEANSTEDEHDCFSDNTHNSHFYNAQGVYNLYLGEYRATSGKVTKGPGIKALLAAKDSKLADTLSKQFENTKAALNQIVDSAEKNNVHFDQLIAPGNSAGANMINNAIIALVTQTGSLEQAAGKLGIQNLNPDNADHEF